jgi:hypothetical protein
MKNLTIIIILVLLLLPGLLYSQIRWKNTDSLFAPLPPSVHVWFTDDSLDGKPNRAYYISLPLKEKTLWFDADTALNRGLTPSAYFARNNNPLVVVNCTFFSPEKHNLNVVVDDGKMVSFNIPSVFSKSDSSYSYTTRSAIGIDRHRNADVAWIFTDATKKVPFRMVKGPLVCSGKNQVLTRGMLKHSCNDDGSKMIKRWKMETAVGGGPGLITDGQINITNEQEKMFAGKAINDRHPRTAMGYTGSQELIILAIEGRFPGRAEGATLRQEAQLLKEIGCFEALNLDGGGSSCLLINGEQTITPSDKSGQRPVPAVFIVKLK